MWHVGRSSDDGRNTFTNCPGKVVRSLPTQFATDPRAAPKAADVHLEDFVYLQGAGRGGRNKAVAVGTSNGRCSGVFLARQALYVSKRTRLRLSGWRDGD